MLMHPDKEKFLTAKKEHLEFMERLEWASLVPRPPGRRVIPNKWVYTYKTAKSANGDVKDGELQANARLVMMGFMQVPGVDYDEKFAPTPPWKVIRLLLALWTIYDWDLAEKRDLKQAYNSTPLQEEMYVEQPVGHQKTGKENWVYRLHKSLPGGKQCGRNLHITLRKSSSLIGDL